MFLRSRIILCLDDLKVNNVGDFEKYLITEFKKTYKDIFKLIKTKLALDETLTKDMKKAMNDIKTKFLAELEK